jgi:hypothetical protein
MDRPLVALVVVAITATACVAETPGQPGPGPGDASTPPTSESRTGKAPPINSPELDLATFEDQVCDLLTAAQVEPFAIRDPGEPSESPAGPACTWNPPDTTAGAQISVAIFNKAQNGWEGVYERRDRFVLFEEAGEINGYPAVHREATSDGTKGTCATVVGARQDLVFEASVFVNRRDSAEYRDACSVSDRVASLVIDTLRGGR